MIFRWPMDDIQPPTTEYYRDKAEEIRQLAGRVRSFEIPLDLIELAVRFGRMAVYAIIAS